MEMQPKLTEVIGEQCLQLELMKMGDPYHISFFAQKVKIKKLRLICSCRGTSVEQRVSGLKRRSCSQRRLSAGGAAPVRQFQYDCLLKGGISIVSRAIKSLMDDLIPVKSTLSWTQINWCTAKLELLDSGRGKLIEAFFDKANALALIWLLKSQTLHPTIMSQIHESVIKAIQMPQHILSNCLTSRFALDQIAINYSNFIVPQNHIYIQFHFHFLDQTQTSLKHIFKVRLQPKERTFEGITSQVIQEEPTAQPEIRTHSEEVDQGKRHQLHNCMSRVGLAKLAKFEIAKYGLYEQPRQENDGLGKENLNPGAL